MPGRPPTQWETTTIPPRLPLVVSTANRSSSTSKDGRLVNCYFEHDAETNEINIIKRPGLTSAGDIASNQAGMGLYNWRGDVYSVFNGTLYKGGTSVATGLDNTNGVYQFYEILGATPKMVLGNGVKTYAYESIGGITSDLHSIDTNFPATTVKGYAYLNGALYVMQPGAQIWGSAVNAISSSGDWDPLNFITAQIEPDQGVALSKQLVYVVAFKETSTEFFFDAGNATGSPLGPVEGAKLNHGCASADSVQRIEDSLFFITVNKTSSYQIGLIENLRYATVSTKAVDRLLKGADLTTVYSWQLRIDGHAFYGVTIVNANLTLVYDIVERRWHQWTDNNGNYFPICASTYDSSGRHIFQHATNGYLYYVDSDSFLDYLSDIPVDIYTPIFDGGTSRKKQLSEMSLVCDKLDGGVLQARHSDDDYTTWSKFRNFDLGQERPSINDEGTFRRRAYNFHFQQNARFRIQAVELQYDVGVL